MNKKEITMVLKIQKILDNNNINDKILQFNSKTKTITTNIYGEILYYEYKKLFNSISVKKFYSYGDAIFDSKTKKIKTEITAFLKKEACKNAGKINAEKNIDKIKETFKKYRNENPNAVYKFNKGHTPWNKGKTKETDNRLFVFSERMLGNNNPSVKYGYPQSAKDKQSKTIKQKILDGTFTPNTNNRKTCYNIEYNGKKYRSSWEVLFAYLNPSFEYEKLRIKYIFCNKERIYIVDFIDHNKKQVVEVKPSSIISQPIMQAKQKYLINWCNENGYQYILWDETVFNLYKDKIEYSNFSENICKKIMGIFK